MRTFVVAGHSTAWKEMFQAKGDVIILDTLTYPFGRIEGDAAVSSKTSAEIRSRAAYRYSPIGIASAVVIERSLGRIQNVPLRWAWLTALVAGVRWLLRRSPNPQDHQAIPKDRSPEYLCPVDGGLSTALAKADAQAEDQLVLVKPTEAELEAVAGATVADRRLRALTCYVLIDSQKAVLPVSKTTWLRALDLAFTRPVQIVESRDAEDVGVSPQR